MKNSEETKQKRNHLEPVGWLAVGVAIGYAAFATLRRKKVSVGELFDVDSVLKSCDKAADQLDRLMRDDSTAQAS